MFHTHGACRCQPALPASDCELGILSTIQQFRTLLHLISFVLYYLFICLFIYSYGDVMRQD
jgi:hypothetical protein